MSDIPERMRGVGIREAGGPDVLEAGDYSTPEPGPDDVLIKVVAAGVNRPDCLQRAGLYPLPIGASPLPGLEVAGIVVAAGTNAARWKIGDRVVALTHGGGYAEYCRAYHEHVLPWPEQLDAAAAATLPETTFTVHHNLLERGQLKSGEAVLIHGGSSGIGTTAIQVAKAIGARVITTAGSDEKCEFCLGLGADEAINYRERDFEEAVGELTGGTGVNVVLDMVAGDYVMKNMRVLGEDGRYVMIAFLHGPKAEVNFATFLPRRLTMMGSTLRPQSDAMKALIARNVEREIWPLVAEHRVISHIYARFPLTEAAAAHALMESSTHMGKIVLDVLPEM